MTEGSGAAMHKSNRPAAALSRRLLLHPLLAPQLVHDADLLDEAV